MRPTDLICLSLILCIVLTYAGVVCVLCPTHEEIKMEQNTYVTEWQESLQTKPPKIAGGMPWDYEQWSDDIPAPKEKKSE